MKKLLYLALVALVCTVFASFKTPGDSCPYEVALNGYKAMMGGGAKTSPRMCHPTLTLRFLKNLKKSARAPSST